MLLGGGVAAQARPKPIWPHLRRLHWLPSGQAIKHKIWPTAQAPDGFRLQH